VKTLRHISRLFAQLPVLVTFTQAYLNLQSSSQVTVTSSSLSIPLIAQSFTLVARSYSRIEEMANLPGKL
jgi:hypothetical protein